MTDNNTPAFALWRFLDGAASISASMLLAVTLNGCGWCNGLPLLSYLNGIANRDDGVIITATLLLFPTTAALYEVLRMFFAAKHAAEQAAKRKARERERQERERERQTHERGRREGIKEGVKSGRQSERERISAALEQHGVQLTPELANILAGDDK